MVWDVYERIFSSHWLLTSYNGIGFVFDFPRIGGGGAITQAIYIMERGTCRYIFDTAQFEVAATFTANRLLNDHRWRQGVYRKIDHYTRTYFNAGEALRQMAADDPSDSAIIRAIRSVIVQQHFHQVYSVLANGVVLDGRNHFSNQLRDELRAAIGSQKKFENLWSLLTQVPKMSLRQRKEYKIAKLAARAKRHSATATERQLRTLHRRYCWLDYNNAGPAANLEQFRQELSAARRSNSHLRLSQELATLKQQQDALMRRLKFNRRTSFLVKLAQHVIWQKGYRKDVQYHGFYCYEPVLQLIAERSGVNDWQLLTFLFPWEIEGFIRARRPTPRQLADRRVYSCFIVRRRGIRILTGKAARTFSRRLGLQEDFSTLKEVHGQCAFAGHVRGQVKIIQTPADMAKMKTGDILVSQATSPDLLPAMRKASAIVTNTGGLICHAAITSRELKIPCVVGTAKATLVFKDGDRVVVDATAGVVKKI